MDLVTREHQDIRYISGPLVFVGGVEHASLGEMVSVLLPGGEKRRGQVIELSERHAVIQMLEETTGMSLAKSRVLFTESVVQMDLSLDLLGRRFNGAGLPIDHYPPVIPEKRAPIIGSPINPVSREKPSHFIQTGISAIDGLNALVRGQKLPIFSGAGLPAKEIAAQILRQATVPEEEGRGAEPFAIVFAAIGIPFREAAFFLEQFEESGATGHTVVFLNLADDPPIERLLTPRFALTAAEYLAFEHDFQVLVILTDMTNYCLAPDTEVLLADGSVEKIGDLVNKLAQEPVLASGFPNILSWDESRPIVSRIKACQKIRYRGKMLRIRTATGTDFSMTPDHKILIDSETGPVMKPGSKLKIGENIYGARRMSIVGWEPSILDLIGDLPSYIHLRDQSIERRLKEKYGTLHSAAGKLELKYLRLTESFHKRCFTPRDLRRVREDLGLTTSELSDLIESISCGKRGRLRFESSLDMEQLLYLFGLVASDGTVFEDHALRSYYVMFSNKQPELLSLFENTAQKLFPGLTIQRHQNQNGVTMLRIHSLPLVAMAKSLGVDADFKPILRLSDRLVAVFLRGYFDGDGSVHGKKCRAFFTTVCKTRAKRLQQLLRRLALVATIRTRTPNCRVVHDIILEGVEQIREFHDQIGSNHVAKMDRLKRHSIRSSRSTGYSSTPLAAFGLLRKARSEAGLRGTDLGASSTVSQLESGHRRTSVQTMIGLNERIHQLVGPGVAWVELNRILAGEYILDTIQSIEEENYDGYVYDFTVEGTHKFLIENGLVVSNCESLREIAMAREEVPGRRGYPGYMYTDLATLYERAGRIIGKRGSVTQIPILTMPDDDITHPIPDLTGYITEGQIVLSRELYRKGIYPPIDVLPCLSRLMNLGIGSGRTREDHRQLADQLYSLYAQGRDLRRLEAIVGQEGITEKDRCILEFANYFEQRFVNQGDQGRTIKETLDLGWELLGHLPKERLTRFKAEYIEQYYKKATDQKSFFTG